MGKNKTIVEDSKKINYPQRISVIVEDSIRKIDVEDWIRKAEEAEAKRSY
jgi:hypothetical protein